LLGEVSDADESSGTGGFGKERRGRSTNWKKVRIAVAGTKKDVSFGFTYGGVLNGDTAEGFGGGEQRGERGREGVEKRGGRSKQRGNLFLSGVLIHTIFTSDGSGCRGSI